MKNQSLKIKVQNYFKKLSAISYQLSANKNGFTLIEIVMIIVIVSIAIPALLIVLGQETQQSVNAELQINAVNVGQAMMDEIKSKNWDQNSPIPPGTYTTPLGLEGTECRTSCTGLQCGANPIYNDVDDYNGLSETCTWGGPSFTTTVAVCYVAATDLNTCVDPTTTDYKRIQVTVQNPSMGSSTLVTLVGNY